MSLTTLISPKKQQNCLDGKQRINRKTLNEKYWRLQKRKWGQIRIDALYVLPYKPFLLMVKRISLALPPPPFPRLMIPKENIKGMCIKCLGKVPDFGVVAMPTRLEKGTVLGESVRVNDEVYLNGVLVLPHNLVTASVHEPSVIL
ncbi:hypothetical protein ACTXT7_011837 [Hymenolepis weldensis]